MGTRIVRPVRLPAALEKEYAGIVRPNSALPSSEYMRALLQHWREMQTLYANVLEHGATQGLLWSLAYDAHQMATEKVRDTVQWLNTHGQKAEASK